MSKELPPEFFVWAYEHGFPERGPRGSEINKVRAREFVRLAKEWRRLQKERVDAPV